MTQLKVHYTNSRRVYVDSFRRGTRFKIRCQNVMIIVTTCKKLGCGWHLKGSCDENFRYSGVPPIQYTKEGIRETAVGFPSLNTSLNKSIQSSQKDLELFIIMLGTVDVVL